MTKDNLILIIKAYEKKLNELMPEEEFSEFVESVARSVFLKTAEELPEGELKEFCQNNTNTILTVRSLTLV